ncbi:MAG TPA: hydroxymyristoyl-ACP dehydratase [Chitinophagaceae bacterium]|nr:hydroxymyristoyl-ACP dehydratase [Chitinophagaceae bacterium]
MPQLNNEMHNDILTYLPYKSSFLFIDNISSLDMNGVTGDYTLRKDAFFYEDHFVNNPVTPGVIITEIMLQIGLVVLGVHLIICENRDAGVNLNEELFPLLTATDVSFFKMVFPGEKVIVTSKKKYFRFGKLKCLAEMHNSTGELVAKGIFSGIINNAVLLKKAK